MTDSLPSLFVFKYMRLSCGIINFEATRTRVDALTINYILRKNPESLKYQYFKVTSSFELHKSRNNHY